MHATNTADHWADRPLDIPVFTQLAPADFVAQEPAPECHDSALSSILRPARAKTPSRRDAENDIWMASYQQFSKIWPKREDDAIRRTHPLFRWVNKQRWLARNNKLSPWKKTLLDSIAFPYEAASTLPKPPDGDGIQEGTKDAQVTAATDGKVITAAHAGYTAVVASPSPERTLVSRAVHSAVYQLTMGRDIHTSHSDLSDLCALATYFEQAVRASIRVGTHDDIWWLKSILGSEITLVKGVHLKDIRTKKLQLKDICPKPGSPRDGTVGLQLRVFDADGQTLQMTLDYDWCLADHTHRVAHPRFYTDPHWSLATKNRTMVHWETWLKTSRRPSERLPSPTNTANTAFFKNYDRLVAVLREFSAAYGTESILNITWGRHYEVYKFIEHVVLRIKQGNFPPHHAIWLARLNFTWGQEWKSIQTLLQKHDGQHETRR